MLWTVGASLLHSGVVINGREYAYGGHDKRGVTGVYWTKPRIEPPGGTFKCEILHGFTLATSEEIDAMLRQASEEFLGTSYNLLTKNCNHFTSYLCKKLTGDAGPAWLNRAASIGVALPCVVPRDWIEPRNMSVLMENSWTMTMNMRMSSRACWDSRGRIFFQNMATNGAARTNGAEAEVVRESRFSETHRADSSGRGESYSGVMITDNLATDCFIFIFGFSLRKGQIGVWRSWLSYEL